MAIQKIIVEGLIPSKKNSKQIFKNRRTGKSFITSSRSYKAWEIQTVLNFKTKLTKVEGEVALYITFYVKSKYKSDLTNKAEGIADALVKAGIIEDDNWFVLKLVTLRMKKADRDYTEIYIIDNTINKE